MQTENTEEMEQKLLERINVAEEEESKKTTEPQEQPEPKVGVKKAKRLFLKNLRPAPRYKEGEIVELAGTKYRVQRDGWRRVE